MIGEAWDLKPSGFALAVGGLRPLGEVALDTLLEDGSDSLHVQLIKFQNPLPTLGLFDASGHRGICVTNAQQEGETSRLKKISPYPDSNNVFLQHEIEGPCFAEFRVVKARDEMVFGVAHRVQEVARVSGFANLRLNSTWSYGRAGRRSMPVLLFAGHNVKTEVEGFLEGDLVAVYVDPGNRQVRFYKNGLLVADNLPAHAFPDEAVLPLKIFCQVDAETDEVEVVRFGPLEPY